MLVAVVRESCPGENRVAIAPASVPGLTSAGLEVVVESSAGESAWFSDQQYVENGAKVVANREELFAADVILQVRAAGANPEASQADLDRFRNGHVVIGTCDPLGSPQAVREIVAALARPGKQCPAAGLWQAITNELCEYAADDSFPIKPQKLVWDLQRTVSPGAIVVCDVGAHKLWMARMFQPKQPNTLVISNGFSAMGIALPGAVAAKLAFPDRTAVAVTGDAGFLMNCQEIETALRIGTPLVVVIWNDRGYGLIEWHQLRQFGRASHVRFGNPDFVKFAESFGAKGYRVRAAGELPSVLKQAIADNTVAVIDCPVDYSENMKLTEKLEKLVCPVGCTGKSRLRMGCSWFRSLSSSVPPKKGFWGPFTRG